MTIFLPTRLPDGSTAELEYLDINEVAEILPFHRNTIRSKLAAHEWSGTHFGRRWYMTRADVADAVAASRYDAVPQLDPGDDAGFPRLGIVVSDDHVDDIGGVR